MATYAKRLPDATRRALPVVTVTHDVAAGTHSANGRPAKHTSMRGRVECTRCLQLIGRGCSSLLGFTVYVPSLGQRRAYCLDCCEIEYVNDSPEWHAKIDAYIAEARANNQARNQGGR